MCPSNFCILEGVVSNYAACVNFTHRKYRKGKSVEDFDHTLDIDDVSWTLFCWGHTCVLVLVHDQGVYSCVCTCIGDPNHSKSIKHHQCPTRDKALSFCPLALLHKKRNSQVRG